MSTITEDMIQLAEDAGACDEGIAWLRAQPRTFQELRKERPCDLRWALFHVDLPELIDYVLANEPSDRELRRIVDNLHAAPYAVLSCAKTSAHLSYLATYNPNAPAEALQIAYDTHTTNNIILRAIARHANTTPELLHTLARAQAAQDAIARNPNTRPETLALIASRWINAEYSITARSVLTAIASSSNTPELLETLALEDYRDVRHAVAANLNSSLTLLGGLTTHPDPATRRIAKRTLHQLDHEHDDETNQD